MPDKVLDPQRWTIPPHLRIASGADPTDAWPALLPAHYATSFSIAGRLAGLIAVPGLLARLGPIGIRSRVLITVTLRVMGNLVTAEDRDVVARAWQAGPAS